jgi:O6-methylguanine-DNA--protein-cysteine methyltransferase
MVNGNVYEALFARHRSAAVPTLWGWQTEVLAAYADVGGDAAVELPTGTGKTLIGLLAGEEFRDREGAPVAYLAGNKQLAQQVERQARDLGFPIVRFQGSKDSWAARDVRAFNFGESIGVMNYWNYFNASPGVEPAGMLILDDVHLLEGPVRDLFTVCVGRGEALYNAVLARIVARCPYYALADDLLNGVEPMRAPEMLVFPDSADLSDEVRDLLDAGLVDGSEAWWAWQRVRDRLEVCCWLVSARAVTFTPYIPPTQVLAHFIEPSRRLYLSATIGSVDDLQRRLGTPPLEKLTASVQPRQGERIVVIRNGTELPTATELVDELRPFLERQRKALWLCARTDTVQAFEFALTLSGLPGQVRRLQGDNGADEPFAAETDGHLIAAGRYDGMDFPGDSCRVEVVPEVPVATSDLEEFVSAYLRDAPFGEARLAQRVAQALGRCNRGEDDRATYILTDPGFLGRFSQRRVLDGLPDDVRGDVYAALERSDRGFAASLGDAERFLGGEALTPPQPPARRPTEPPPTTAADEVNGMLALWREDYGRAASLFDRVGQALAQTREHRAFWLAMRALALKRAADYGDHAAQTQMSAALRAAATAGAASTFFTRLRRAEARLQGVTPPPPDVHDELFAGWDRLIDRHGPDGPQFDRWSARLVGDLRSADHDAVARAIAEVGVELLGLAAAAPAATAGEEDAYWELVAPRRTLTFEVKLAPEAQRVVNDDVEQAEGAAPAAEAARGNGARGVLITPHASVDETAAARLERVRLLKRELFVAEVERLLAVVVDYRRGWSADAATRAARRAAVAADVPAVDWLWQAVERSETWIEQASLELAWHAPAAV